MVVCSHSDQVPYSVWWPFCAVSWASSSQLAGWGLREMQLQILPALALERV